jgi:zinc transporter, ZIP family
MEAVLWGLFGASSLVLGALLAFATDIPSRTIGLIMGFGSGVLISAVAYELVLEASEAASTGLTVGLGLGAGALAFFAGDVFIERRGGGKRKSIEGGQASDSGAAIALGAALDGIPESVTLGITLIGGGGISVSLIAAVFISNVPEAIAASSGMVKGGYRRASILRMWIGVALVSGIAAGAGYLLLGDASGDVVAGTQAFAGGAILTMLADTMMPEAFEHAGPAVGLVTTLGFAVAFGLASL